HLVDVGYPHSLPTRRSSDLEKTKEGAGKVGEEVTDAWIITRIKGKFLGEDALKGSDINVDCDNHVVTLHGTVPTQAGRARAVQRSEEHTSELQSHLNLVCRL